MGRKEGPSTAGAVACACAATFSNGVASRPAKGARARREGAGERCAAGSALAPDARGACLGTDGIADRLFVQAPDALARRDDIG